MSIVPVSIVNTEITVSKPWQLIGFIAAGVLAGNLATLFIIKCAVEIWWHYKVTLG